MADDLDLVIRNGMLIDGSGAEPRAADVGVVGGRIAQVGTIAAKGRTEIDATGHIVTPGFVDIHTHYDGQVTWENRLVPSSSHGVTTIVMGNCGVGFAPCRPTDHDLLIRLMEGVEDIPHPVLTEGVPWHWESYPDYLDFLATRRYDADICGYVPHAPLRVYVMGERGAAREPATAADIAQMARLVREAMAAGAMGVSTSRTFFHRSSDGTTTPTFDAADDELCALALALTDAGKGAIQMISDWDQPEEAFARMQRLVERSGRPLSFTMVEGEAMGPLSMRWPEVLDWVSKANARGLPIKAQVASRAVCFLFGHELTLNPFYSTPSYLALASLPLAERIAALRRPEVRARILAEPIDPDPANVLGRMVRDFDRMFALGDPPDYEPALENSIGAQARRRGCSPEALAYDLMLEQDGNGLLYYTATNYAQGSLESCLAMMRHSGSIIGLGDGGAHCGTICDGSYPTFLLTHWARDRTQGDRLPLPAIVRAMSRETAEAVGLLDRGLVAPGFKADLNVIDTERLHLHAPAIARDLPSGGRRLLQRADGYAATIVNGEIVYRNGEATGALPGRLVRGPQASKAQ
ncbi:MAG: N-acyl-D-amino-acid deacylase family protein [Burkholderiales bacterium]